ncbi:MAG: glycine zipper 2TM domain-containing protein [Gammaproteobacteria bacterium]
MKKSFTSCFAILLMMGSLAACTNNQMGTVGGAAVGGLVGNAITGGSAAGTVVGAVGGGLLGHATIH